MEDLFDLKQIEVDYHGGIYDTRKEISEKIGSIDVQGNIVDERFFNFDDITH